MFFFFDFENYQVSDLIDRMKSIKPLKDIIEATGIPQPNISAWKTRNSFPKADDLYKIAKYLDVSMEYLLTGIESGKNQPELSEKEIEIIKQYRKCDLQSKNHIELIVEALAGK